MNKFYYLDTCDTCKRIMKELPLSGNVTLREIKSSPPTETEIDSLGKKAGSYEAIFSKRARKYRELGLNTQKLAEADFKKYLLSDYTFLKRPVLETSATAISGNSKIATDIMREALK
ncbi:hypothetical protein G3O08_10245 [Cryomorpha ignava]|uniref:Arsenate reductase n=1 Tax=Cryomorpha ignava TaxID=101383 RepID=A0A7K3WQE4_9FLAO|nr:ArsC/Spx/MgsR family protein [Cryomorpha ignava]NEN23880.1 hypothetical protein [Cryomorpha ignava]